MNEVIGLRGKVKTDGLPPRVVRKTAKGRTYYYYNTGKRNERGTFIHVKLPEPTDPRFPDALLEAKLIRWRMCQTPIVPIPLMLAPPSGDDLYFIRSGDAVKIGRARDVGARMVNMQVNNPVELDCICRLPNRGWEEKEWHERFQHLVVRGEWFKWVPELAEAINAARIQFAEAMAA